jgi:hypothetical protein
MSKGNKTPAKSNKPKLALNVKKKARTRMPRIVLKIETIRGVYYREIPSLF